MGSGRLARTTPSGGQCSETPFLRCHLVWNHECCEERQQQHNQRGPALCNAKSKKKNNKTIIHLQGRLDAATVPVLENSCLRSLGDEEHVVLDMTQLEFISSAGIRILIPLMKRHVCGGEKLVVCGLNEQVHELMKVTRLDEFLSIYPNLEDALA